MFSFRSLPLQSHTFLIPSNDSHTEVITKKKKTKNANAEENTNNSGQTNKYKENINQYILQHNQPYTCVLFVRTFFLMPFLPCEYKMNRKLTRLQAK